MLGTGEVFPGGRNSKHKAEICGGKEELKQIKFWTGHPKPGALVLARPLATSRWGPEMTAFHTFPPPGPIHCGPHLTVSPLEAFHTLLIWNEQTNAKLTTAPDLHVFGGAAKGLI